MGCTPSQPSDAIAEGSQHSKRQPPRRQDSNRSLRSSSSAKHRRGGSRKGGSTSAYRNGGSHSALMNGGTSHHSEINATTDRRYHQLWKSHKDILVDPADLHAAIEGCMARSINKLSVTEVTFLQRKVRSVVRASNQPNEKGGRMFRSNSSNLSTHQEIKAVAEKYHLLSQYAVRKILPALSEAPAVASNGKHRPDTLSESSSSVQSPIAENVYTLGLFLHESLWDGAAMIAESIAHKAGVEMDVNKYNLPAETPELVPPVRDDRPQTPHGISLHSLTFLISLALRGSRMQRVQLLFYLLLPPEVLQDFLDEHPNGGVPLWLLEVGSESMLSMASLAHYYYYGDTFVPSESFTSATEVEFVEGISSHQSRLALDPMTIIHLLGLVFRPIEAPPGEANGTILSPEGIGMNGYGKKSPPKTRRRGSNQISEEEFIMSTPQSEVMTQITQPLFKLADYIQNPDEKQGLFEAAADDLRQKKSVSMKEFAIFCEAALDDQTLDAIMNRFFAHSILPSPSMELVLVKRRWQNWKETEGALYCKAMDSPGGTFEMLSQSIRQVLLRQTGEALEPQNKPRILSQPFGGLGGIDGRGALGFGIMYCIDKAWWSKWEEYTAWSWAGEDKRNIKNTTHCIKRPGGLTLDSLLDRYDDEVLAGTFGSYELMKKSLQRDVDYVLIPSGVWDILYELYGGGPPLPRIVLPPNGLSSVDSTSSISQSTTKNNANAISKSPESVVMDSDDMPDRVPRIPSQLKVSTHPWIFHFHLCDPQQPYRRGDAGPLSIRLMATPDQPLWRLFSELVARLPFHLYRIFDDDGQAKARIWKRIDTSGTQKSGSAFGPWSLLCKNREAIVPKNLKVFKSEKEFQELEENWKIFTDNASVESIGLTHGDHLMVECAIVSRSGGRVWPREAAAKAGRVKRLEEMDKKFRRFLRGVDENNKPLAVPSALVGKRVDAMDISGKWFEVSIEKVQTVTIDTDEEDSMGSDTELLDQNTGESRQVLVSFDEHGGHNEWIDTHSDRLASPGRFTVTDVDDSLEIKNETNDGSSGSLASNGNSKTQAQIKKNGDTSEGNAKICTIPGYGACGLTNIGNTCYANSAIQCVSYLPLLRAYLLSTRYKATGDLNKDNPLGTEGKLLEEFADLLKVMWSAKIGEKSPVRFKTLLGKTNMLFQGADQQDSQEFLSYILDVLHEDSNRVMKKPYVEGLEDEWKKKNSLPRVGEEEWRRFLRRNRSIMADTGMGQVLNQVTCPECQFSSRNFDPFNLLSLPFPTVADVIFQCFVIRRATATNAPWVLNRGRKDAKGEIRLLRQEKVNTNPPSESLVIEEYVIAMSRVADSSDLKVKIQELTGIPSSLLTICRADKITSSNPKADAIIKSHTQLSVLTDKEGPCSQLANRQRANSEDLASTQTSPSIIVAFQSTIRPRPSDDSSNSGDSDSNHSESLNEKDGDQGIPDNEKERKELERHLEQYGNEEECRLYDTETVLIAKALSRSIWPDSESELTLGLRVDALDQKNHYCSGSVVEIIHDAPENNTSEREAGGRNVQVRVHFDSYASKWDLNYDIKHFKEGQVKPIYTHTQPRPKPTEFVVHHRYTDRASRLSSLFGQSFYVQCCNEWTTARAGAQILAQASRFLKLPSEIGSIASEEIEPERAAKIKRLYDRTQALISDLIDLLIDYDRAYVHCALGLEMDENQKSKQQSKRFRNPGFDASNLSQNLMKKVGAILPRLPFEVRICTIDSTLGPTTDESSYSFSLMRSIGNYMTTRHAIILQWREPPTDRKAPNGRSGNYLGAPVMYLPAPVVVDSSSADILANHKKKRSTNAPGSGGISLDVCLAEYCKLQQLPTWRCPKCKDFRDGKQNMALWRLPDLLTIHLKRFNCSARWREKITTKVNFPLTGLDLEQWCHPDSTVIQEDSTGESYVYDLVGVLNHYGGMTGGHYVATCKASTCSKDGSEEVAYDFNGVGVTRPHFYENDTDFDTPSGWKFGRQKPESSNKKQMAINTARAASESAEPLWLQFDDEMVEPVPPKNVISETAYVLFYRRRRLTPANVARYSTLE